MEIRLKMTPPPSSLSQPASRSVQLKEGWEEGGADSLATHVSGAVHQK